MKRKILIYRDYGCADVNNLYRTLKENFDRQNVAVEMTDAAEILKRNALNSNVLAFFMPGGAATPYRTKLGYQGNEKIRDYVKNGGVYFGICAGAYYASSCCRFEEDVPNLAVVEDYGLNLVEADAVGTLKKDLKINPYSRTPSSLAVTSVVWNEDGEKHSVFYHGGPKFEIHNMKNHEVLASYGDVSENPPAIVFRRFGKGAAILSGVHFEDGINSLKRFVGCGEEDKRQIEMLSAQLEKGEESRKKLIEKIVCRLCER